MKNKKIEKIITQKIIEKCQSISSSEVIRGKQKIIDQYYSIKGIEQVLKDYFKGN